MNKLIIIAAIGKNYELGIAEKNKMPWSLPGDLKYFKEQTLDQTILMGRKTFESLGRILPRRKHIVLTTDDNWQYENVDVYNSFNSLFENESLYYGNIYVIGGATIYNQFINLADELLLTEINGFFPEANVFFPKFDKTIYDRFENGAGQDNNISYKFLRYVRKDS